jgi:hypothetical protein
MSIFMEDNNILRFYLKYPVIGKIILINMMICAMLKDILLETPKTKLLLLCRCFVKFTLIWG